MSIFEQAARMRLRFSTEKGNVSVEDLWDLPLTALDTLAKGLRRVLQDSNMESFIKPLQNKNTALELQFKVVKHIITARLAELKDAEDVEVKRQKRAQIMLIIEAKDNEALHSSSKEELMALLENL